MRHLSVSALVLAAAIGVTGCGASDSTDGGGGGGGGAGAQDSAGINVDQARKDLAAVVDEPSDYELPAVGGTVPRNKTISFMTCPLAICTQVGEGVKEAATVLGWRVRTIPNNLTPSGYKQAWQQIAQNPGDGVMTTAPILPDSAVRGLIDKANAPYVAVTSPSGPEGRKIAVIASRDAVEREGVLEANWVIQDAGKPVKSLFVYDPSIAGITSAPDGYRAAMAKNCPECSFDVLKISSAKVGPALAQEVVSELQRKPDVGYVVFGLGDFATGVPAAIKAAGLSDKVKVVVRGATPPNLTDVKGGGIAAAFTSEIYEAGWRAVDKLVRALADKPIGNPTPFSKNRLLTKENLPADISTSYTIPDYQDGFKKAWGVG